MEVRILDAGTGQGNVRALVSGSGCEWRFLNADVRSCIRPRWTGWEKPACGVGDDRLHQVQQGWGRWQKLMGTMREVGPDAATQMG